MRPASSPPPNAAPRSVRTSLTTAGAAKLKQAVALQQQQQQKRPGEANQFTKAVRLGFEARQVELDFERTLGEVKRAGAASPRVRCRTPPPHVTEHAFHCDSSQAASTQSSGQFAALHCCERSSAGQALPPCAGNVSIARVL